MFNYWVVYTFTCASDVKIIAVITQTPNDDVYEHFAFKYGIDKRKINIVSAMHEKYRICAANECMNATVDLSHKYCYLHENDNGD